MPETKPELVQEFFDSRGQTLSSDPAAGLLRGVKLLGLRSRNGRRYLERALRDAISLYEGAKVNVNHPDGDPLAARDYRDRLGVIRNVKVEPGEGLYGDLHFNPRHHLAEQLAWDAEHAPENVGLSHNVLARTSRDDEGSLIVEAITRVQSVDLVADPATTCGLFEHALPLPNNEELIDDTELCEELHALRRKAAIGEIAIRKTLSLPDQEEEQATSQAFLEQLMATEGDNEVERLILERSQQVQEAAKHAARTRSPESREQAIGELSYSDKRPIDSKSFVKAITGR